MEKQRDILLISNDSNVRSVGTIMLEIVGYTVHTASSMRDALGILSSESIGLIVSGLELDDIRSIDFLTYLKNDPLRQSIPFVFYIHKNSQDNLSSKQALDMGAVDVILYPVVPDEFIRRIGKLLPSAIGSDVKAPDEPAPPTEEVLPEKEETGTDQQSSAADNEDVHISLDDEVWTECHVTYHTFHGVMVETRLRGQQGSTISLRYGMPDGPLTATGRIMHILMGDQERPTGIGINFQGDTNWHKIQFQMKSAAARAKPAPAPPDDRKQAPSTTAAEKEGPDQRVSPAIPIGIEVSRDASLWMFGEITEYGKTGASISTPVLGKSGETLHIRITMPGGKNILKAQIKQVTLNDFKMPAGMEITFPEKDPWLTIIKNFAGNLGYEPPEESIPKTPSEAPFEPASEKEAPKSNWTHTVIDGKKTSQPENIKHRFYTSLIGKKLGNYEIVSFLNAGSMGGVFKGWDIALERDVAIKVVSYELSSQKEFVEMFFKEARLISKVNHPNIAHIYFIGNETGIVYYTMEFIHGKTLSALIEKTPRIQPEKAVPYLIDVCRALDCVWLEKIIHYDIKPANIMISEHGAAKLLDFGVARQKKIGAIREKRIVGTPAYMSPESIRKEAVDFRSDIYSLGATFYHVLSGVTPFRDKNLKGMLLKHLHETPVPLAEILPSLSGPISNVIHKMLAKHPNDRFQSYQGIINALTHENYNTNR